MLKRIVLSLVLATTATSVSWALFEEREEKSESSESAKIQLDQTPAAVQKAIRKAAGKAKITKVEKETDDGRTCYEAGWKVGDVDQEVVVSKTGDVMETEMAVTADAVPAAVRKAAAKHSPKGATTKFELKTVTLYEIEVMVDGHETEMLVDATGRVVELEADDEHDEVDADEEHEDDDDDDGDDDDDDEEENE
tara:strand:+ start:797 stop:1378 length:582 start_codon:yes stop_codon:yes gene_type:complete